jgi:hypothetical protein
VAKKRKSGGGGHHSLVQRTSRFWRWSVGQDSPIRVLASIIVAASSIWLAIKANELIHQQNEIIMQDFVPIITARLISANQLGNDAYDGDVIVISNIGYAIPGELTVDYFAFAGFEFIK